MHPWHPRVAPWGIYLVFLAVIVAARDLSPLTYPFLYTAQCVIVLWLLWRYRRLTPELTLRFHWLSLVAGLGVAWLWIVMGDWMVMMFPARFGDVGTRPFFAEDQMGPAMGWVAMSLRLLGMSLVVPIFEELFNRSLLLRSLQRMRRTGTGLVQLALDFPLLGDWLRETKLGERADESAPVFGAEFESTPLGRLSVFGVLATTIVFMSVHVLRDWPACFLCGVVYCLVLNATRRRGLGPVIWTHGITNAALWVYTVWTHVSAEMPLENWPYL